MIDSTAHRTTKLFCFSLLNAECTYHMQMVDFAYGDAAVNNLQTYVFRLTYGVEVVLWYVPG